jgi:2-keto-4-pentenoate hydratase/2-oxohepta-3-ene-1,7-dioic acid hydratase in catechol pathway
MRLVRFQSNTGPRYAAVDGDVATELRASPFEGAVELWGPVHHLTDLRLLAPCAPSKIVCVSGSYREIIKAFNKPFPKEPLIFFKPPTAVIGPDEAIVWPDDVEDLTHEPELAVVMGRPCRGADPAEAERCILGYTCHNDVSAWDVLQREVQFGRCKGYDTFAPLGPFIVSGLDPDNLGIRSYVNGARALETTTGDMVFRVRETVSFISRWLTLYPGDVICTGASGVGHLQPGDRVDIEIDGIGRLSNPVVRRRAT